MDPSSRRNPTDELAQALAPMTDVLVALAAGDFEARVPRTLDGGPVDVLAFLVNAMADEVAVLVQDLERERAALEAARDKLVLAEKLVAIGEISAGVAHELNQPLTVIRMLTELLAMRPHDTIEAHARDLALLEDAITRMTRIVDSVQAFACGPALRRELVCAEEPVDAALGLLEAPLRRARIVVDRPERSERAPVIAIDRERICQVFVNVLSNACYALETMPEEQPRTIRIATSTLPSSVVFRVADDGPGVANEHASRLFDPFFTTKPPGHGAGLGLSVSHGIVRDHGGVIRFEPASPSGACFVIELPRMKVGAR